MTSSETSTMSSEAAIEALRQSEARLKLATEAGGVGLWDWDLRSNQIYYSPECKRQLGYADHELADRFEDWEQRLHPDDRNRVHTTVANYLAAPWPDYEIEFRLRHRDGSYRWIFTRGMLQYDAAGKPVRMLGSHIDITERKAAEEALRASHQTLLAGITSAPLSIAMFDREMRCLAASQRWIEDYGRGRTDIVGLSHYELHPDLPERWKQIHQRGLAGQTLSNDEDHWIQADGSEHWLRWAVVPWRTAQGEIGGIIMSAENITARKRAEANKLRLEQLLMQAQKMEAIGQLTAGIAHDFNNILASVLGYTGLALDRYVPDKSSKLAEYLRQVQTAGSRARELIAGLLAFSRSGPSQPRHVELVPLVKEVMKTLAQTIPSSIQLRSHIELSDAAVVADAVQLYQVVMNLVINARDAVGEHGRIDVALRRVTIPNTQCTACHADFDGDFVEIAVSDTGTGIPADIMARIFDPFFTTKAPGRGSGLGLSVVHGVVHECGGHILIESVPHRGTTMRILLPMSSDTAVDTMSITRASQKSGSGRHILVIDDDAALAHLLGEMLGAQDYKVSVFTQSRPALERFKAAPDDFDAVISDQTMPELTGVELAKSIRAIRPNAPIILTTGYSASLDPDVAAHLGARLLYKPAPLDELLATLEELLAAKA